MVGAGARVLKNANYPNLQRTQKALISLNAFKIFFVAINTPKPPLINFMKSPLRYLYENVYGTTITLSDELYYILICIKESVRIVLTNKKHI